MSRMFVIVLCVVAIAGAPFVTSADEPNESAETDPIGGGSTMNEASELPVVEGELVVSVPRIEIPLVENPAATTVVGDSELAAMPRAVAVDEALRLVPGVKVDNQLNGEKVHLSIRGQGLLTERGIRGIKVLLDGLPLNDPTGFAPDLYDVDWATVDRVEVLRGPASSLYGGGASGGILSIETRGGGVDAFGGRLRVTGGSNGFWKFLAEAGGTTDTGIDYRVSASRTFGDGYRDHSAFDATNLYAKLGLWQGRRGRVSAIVAGTDYFTENPEGLNLDQVQEDPTQANPDAGVFNELQQTRRGTVGVVSEWHLTDTQSLQVTGVFRHSQWREAVPSTVQHRTFDSPGLLLQYNLRGTIGGLDNELSVGFDLDGQTFDEIRRPNLGGAREGSEVVTDQTVDQLAWGVWVQDRLRLGRDLSLVLGARHDDISNELEDHLMAGGIDRSGDASFAETTGRLGLAWSPQPELGLYASWGTGFLPPATEELANNPGNPGGFNEDLVSATSTGVEVGARGRLGRRLGYDVAVFRLETLDDFGRYRIPERPLETFYQNAGDSTRWGVETRLDWSPLNALTVRLAYTYSHFVYDRVVVAGDELDGTWLPNAPEHEAYLDVAGKLGHGLSAGAGVEWVDSWYIDATNATSVDGSTLLNARVARQFRVGPCSGEVLLSGRNLTNELFIAFTEPDPDGNSYQPGPGREGFLGVAIAF